MANGKAAIDYVLSQLPEVDPQRIYAAGHSSAADVALDLAAEDPRRSRCGCLRPGHGHRCPLWRQDVDPRSSDSGRGSISVRLVPIHRVNDFSCPVLVFHADDDTNVPTAETRLSPMPWEGRQSDHVQTRAGGGHYDSMIHEGSRRESHSSIRSAHALCREWPNKPRFGATAPRFVLRSRAARKAANETV